MSNKIIFIKTVEEKIDRSKQSIWRYVKAGNFPKPKKIEGRNAWYESVIDQWISERMGEEEIRT